MDAPEPAMTGITKSISPQVVRHLVGRHEELIASAQRQLTQSAIACQESTRLILASQALLTERPVRAPETFGVGPPDASV